jgi:large subunit ribosomal protein L9
LEEAKLQASGKSIQDLAAEKEQEAEFEIAELFDDIGSAALDDEDLRTDEKPEVVEDIETETSPDIKTE